MTTWKSHAGVALVAVLSVGVLGGCASKGDVQYLHDEVRRLAIRQDSMYRALAVAVQAGDRETQDSLLALSGFLFDWRGDMSNRLAGLQDQQRRVAEYVGQNQRNLAGIGEELIAQRRRLDERLAEPVEEDVPETDSADGSAPAGDEGAAQAAYDVGVRHVNLGNAVAARSSFEHFVERYPNSTLAPAAYIHLGELLSVEERFSEAVEAYLTVPERFPAADQVPEALYRAALVQIEVEDMDSARQLLERLVNTYPEHRHADRARERLGEIP